MNHDLCRTIRTASTHPIAGSCSIDMDVDEEEHDGRQAPNYAIAASSAESAGQGDRCSPAWTRGSHGEPALTATAQSPDSSTPAPRCTRAGLAESAAATAQPEIELTAATMATRSEKMFRVDLSGPVASGMGAAAMAPTNQLVHLAFELIATQWKQPHAVCSFACFRQL